MLPLFQHQTILSSAFSLKFRLLTKNLSASFISRFSQHPTTHSFSWGSVAQKCQFPPHIYLGFKIIFNVAVAAAHLLISIMKQKHVIIFERGVIFRLRLGVENAQLSSQVDCRTKRHRNCVAGSMMQIFSTFT